MRITLSGDNLEITDPFRKYVNKKFAPLGERVKRFDKDADAPEAEAGKETIELQIIVERTTDHHRKGNIYQASADLHLPNEILHAQETSEEARKAIDEVKNILSREINKYRTKHLPHL